MQADYCDLRFIKGRKVIQVVLELPIEAGAQFVSMFGTPDPSKTIPVGIARIDPSKKSNRERLEEALAKPKGGKLAQRAGIICSEKPFLVFLDDAEEYGEPFQSGTKDPAQYIRELCHIDSRAELDHNSEAARKFHDLELSYNAWKIAA